MADKPGNPQVADNNMDSKAVEKLNEMRDKEPVSPTPTTEANKDPQDNQLTDNERKAENELAEIERLKSLGISNDNHTEEAVKEQLEYERTQREQREEAHGQQVTDKQHKKLDASGTDK